MDNPIKPDLVAAIEKLFLSSSEEEEMHLGFRLLRAVQPQKQRCLYVIAADTRDGQEFASSCRCTAHCFSTVEMMKGLTGVVFVVLPYEGLDSFRRLRYQDMLTTLKALHNITVINVQEWR